MIRPSLPNTRESRSVSKPPSVLRVRMLSFTAIRDRKSTRLNSSHQIISYPVFCLKKKTHDAALVWAHPFLAAGKPGFFTVSDEHACLVFALSANMALDPGTPVEGAPAASACLLG